MCENKIGEKIIKERNGEGKGNKSARAEESERASAENKRRRRKLFNKKISL